MGGLVGGLFDLISGDPTSSENKALESLSSFQNPLGEKNVKSASDYYGGIMSGDPTQIAMTLSPEIKAGQDMVNQHALTNAEFGNRGGGTNAATQSAQAGERGNIINLIGETRGHAADAQAGLGENLMNMGSTNLSKQAQLDMANRQRKVGDVTGIANSVASIAMPFLAPAAAAGQAAGGVVGQLNPAFAATQFGPEPASFSGDFYEGLGNA